MNIQTYVNNFHIPTRTVHINTLQSSTNGVCNSGRRRILCDKETYEMFGKCNASG